MLQKGWQNSPDGIHYLQNVRKEQNMKKNEIKLDAEITIDGTWYVVADIEEDGFWGIDQDGYEIFVKFEK